MDVPLSTARRAFPRPSRWRAEEKQGAPHGPRRSASRLMPEKPGAIHKAAGPGKASKFVRALAAAAARNDAAAVKAIMEGVQTEK